MDSAANCLVPDGKEMSEWDLGLIMLDVGESVRPVDVEDSVLV